MTTPTTPYALFRFVPLSDIRIVWRCYRKVKFVLPRVARLMELENMLLCAQLAAVTAERDETQRALDGALDNLEHVTAERDALRRELDTMTGEL